MGAELEPHTAVTPAPEVSPEKTASLDDDELLDDAALLVGNHREPIDPKAEARVRRKIDFFLVPYMFLAYGFTYYDKAILGSAVLFGLAADLSLEVEVSKNPPTYSTSRLSWATSLFYFGTLCGLYPMSLLLQRFRRRWVLGPVVFLWGVIAMLTATVTSWQGLYVQRFFLGFVESIIPAAFSVIVSGWYRQEEQGLRQSFWFSGSCAFTIIGGALNYGFGQIKGGDLKRWQYIYLLAGSLTVIFGVVSFFVPDSPVDAWFLKPEEKRIAVERLREGQTGVRNHRLKAHQAKQALFDPKYWLVFFMMAASYVINGAVTGFGPLIVSTFGWSTLDSILFQFPLSVACWSSMLVTGYIATRNRRVMHLMLVACALPVIAGCAIIWKSTWDHHAPAPIIGYSLLGFWGADVTLIINIGMANVAGATKKSLMSANIFVAYCVGNIIGPQLVNSKSKARHYPELWTGIIICFSILIGLAGVSFAYLRHQNARRSRGDVKRSDLQDVDSDELAFRDLTDGDNPHFRYVY